MILNDKKVSNFDNLKTYQKWLKLPSEDNRYYSFLPKEVAKGFHQRYKERPDFYRKDSKDAAERWYGDDHINTKANEYLTSEFPYAEFMEKRMKYKYDRLFSYIEKWDIYLVLLIWQQYGNKKWYLERVFFFQPQTEEQFAFSIGKFKQMYLMLPAEEVKYMGSFQTAYDMFYSYYQRIQHPDTTKLLKSTGKFQYLPFEKLEKINYFKILNTSEEAVYNYELLLKAGAKKLAFGLLMRRRMITKDLLINIKHLLKLNRSFEYYDEILDSLINKKRDAKKRLTLKKIDAKMNNMQRLYFEVGKYILFSPTSLKQMQHESNILNHCLGKSMIERYSSKIVNKETVILFLRLKDKPDEPMYTVQITDGVLTQCRTKNNAVDPKVTDLMKSFIQSNIDKLSFDNQQIQCN